MAFSMAINSLDITHYIAKDGFKWEENDIDAPNSGRDATGTMRRTVIARKAKISVTCRSLTYTELNNLNTVLANATVSVTYTKPGNTATTTGTFYNSKRAAGVVIDNGTAQVYDGISFNLIEV